MTCPSCGNTLAQDVHFCTHCGAPIPQAPTWQAPPAPVYANMPVYPYTRVARHIQIAGILWAVYAVESAVSRLIGLMFLHGIFGSHVHSDWGSGWSPFATFGFAAIWPVIVVSLVVGLVLSAITAYALLTKQPWGRIIAIVVSVLALFHPIFGTALGIYTLWVLAPAASGVEYAAIAHATPR